MQENWKGPLGREYWESKAEQAWVDLGKQRPNPSPSNPTQNDLDYDAFRHAYTSALWARQVGVDAARAGGDYIEISNPRNFSSDKGQRDMRGDLINNEKGREIGKNTTPDSSDRQIAEQVADALKRGDLVIDKQTDPRTLPENFPQELNPKDWKDVPSDIWGRWLDQLEKDILDTLLDWSKSLSDFGKNIKDWWDRAKNWVWPRDPIILDLDGNGLESVGLAANVHFDHDGDGVLTRTGWVGKDDALLVWDRNANGRIDTGAELFGDFTPLPNGTLAPNGFAALAALDANGDGVIDATDPMFAELKLWRDTSQDGQTGEGELISLADAGIVSLNLAHSVKNQRLANGNTLAREGSFTRADGTSSGMGEFHFATDTFSTKFAEAVEVPEALKALPTMGGAGNVRELQQAAAQSSRLAGVLSQFQSAGTRADQRAMLDRLVTEWAGTSGMAKTLEARVAGQYRIVYEGFGNVTRAQNIAGLVATVAAPVGMGSTPLMTDFDGSHLTERYRNLISEWSRKLHVLEAFNGQYFFNLPVQRSQTPGANWGLAMVAGTPSTGGDAASAISALPTLRVNYSQAQIDLLQQAYDSLKESVYAGLVLQTRLRPYLDQIDIVIDQQGLRLDATKLNQLLADKKAADPENYLADLLDLDRYASGFLSGTNWVGLADFDSLVDGLPQSAGIAALLDEFKVRRLTSGNDNPSLTDQSDIVLAGEGNDALYGQNGNDRLFGQAGDDRIFGGSGNDLISGGAGNDLLYGEAGADTYVYGRGYGNDTIFDYAENGVRRDTVRFLGLNPADVRVTADFSDNLVFTIQDTGETLSVPRSGYWWGQNGVGQYVFDDGTVWSHDDALRATVAAGTDAADVIHGSSAGDRIVGQAGDDILIGNGGNDVIDGGAGNDLLVGSTGLSWFWENDGYRVERSMTPEVSANGDDIYLFGRGDGQDTVIDGDSTPGNVDTLRFKDGVQPSDVRFIRTGEDLVLALRGTDDKITLKHYFQETWNGQHGPYLIERIAFADGRLLSFADVQAILFAGSDDADTIVGSRQADLIKGRGGNDILIGNGGDDRLEGGDGDDVLLGGAGRDILDGGAGNDVLRGGGALWASQISDWHSEGDVYRFGRGDGHDIIIEDALPQGGNDRIELKAGLTQDSVRLERVRTVNGWQVSDDLKLTIRDTGETLTVKNHFSESNRHAVEEIVFADGTTWGLDDIRTRVLLGEADDDMLRGFQGRDDVLEGGGGDDRLHGLSGNDLLLGGGGKDELHGGDGDDVLVGGADNDILDGGRGSDTYRYELGDGQDVINEAYADGVDVLELGPGIAPADVSARWTMQGALVLGFPDGGRVTVIGQADTWSVLRGIEQLRFADGTVWSRDDMAAQALRATAGDDVIVGGYLDDALEGGAGNDRFQNLGGYDTYRFGLGDGQDVIEATWGRIQFKAGIDQNGVVFSRDGNDLIATLATSGDTIRAKDWLNNWQRIDRFEFDNGAHLSAEDVLAKLNVGEASEILYGSPGADTLTGTEKSSVIYGRGGNDVLIGAAGQDELFGEDGDDVLDGGADRDWLYGGSGNNVYILARGTGLDTAVGASLDVANDTVLFGPGVRPEDVSVQLGQSSLWWDREPGDVGYENLVIGIGGNDALMVRGPEWKDLGRGAIQRFRFEDGTEWTLSELVARADGGTVGWQNRDWWGDTTLIGSEADDNIYAPSGHSVIVRARGNDDYVQLASGDDIVSAGTGSDTVYSGYGDDVIAGEAGDDFVRADGGDDVIVFNYGDGHDTVRGGEGTDALSFGTTVTPGMLSVGINRDGHLVLFVDGGAGGSIVLEGVGQNDEPSDVERIQFIDADGKARVFDFSGWLRANVAAMLGASPDERFAFDGGGYELTGSVAPAGGLEAVAYAQSGDLFANAQLTHNIPTDGDDVLYGTAGVDTLDAGAGHDIVLGLGGDDIIMGGEGNDLILGGDGDDVLDGGDGDDVIYGGRGADTLSGGAGRDELYGEWGGDTYLYRAGDGVVVIDDDHRLLNWAYGGEGGYARSELWDGGEGGWYGGTLFDEAPNILSFGPGIRPEDLRYSQENGDLVIDFVGRAADRVILRGFEPSRATQTRSVDIFSFADGTEIVAESIDPAGLTEVAGDEDTWLNGTPFSDVLIGGDGNDVLDGRGGADRLVGGFGSDTYRIYKEWGSRPTEALISETWREQDFNRIELFGEFNVDTLSLEFDGRDLLLRLTEEGDVIRFTGFDPRAPGMPAPVAEISLPWWGVTLSFEELLSRGLRIVGTPNDDVLVGTALADWIAGRGADDTMSGGGGGDLYFIEADGGTDTILDSEDGDAPNVLVLPEGTTADDLRLSYDRQGFLVLDIESTGNRVRLSGFDPENPMGPRAVQRFRFGFDGDEISYEALLDRGFDIFGTEQGDALKGTVLTDRIRGGDGNDLIEATQGGDLLMGEGGNDVYVVSRGDGVVTIDDLAEVGAGNVLRFGSGIDPNELRNNLRFEADGNGGHALLIAYGNVGDVVRLTGFNPQDVLGSRAVERFEFADGTAVDYATLVSWTFAVEGDSSGNALTGTNVADRLYGYDGDDLLEAGYGEDVLTGGAGNDVLRGCGGRDAYVVNIGDGQDVIEDLVEGGVGNVLTFGDGITRQDVRVQLEGNDLLIHYGQQGDMVRIANHASNGAGVGSVIDTFEFADGTAISLREFMNRAPQLAEAVASQLLLEDAAFSLALPDSLFLDADGDTVFTRVAVSGYARPPHWLKYDAATRTLYGTPENDDVGEFDIIVEGMDAMGASALHSFHVTVRNTNDAPEAGVLLTGRRALQGLPFVFEIPADSFYDVDAGDMLTYSATLLNGDPLPAWLSFDARTRTFSATPTKGDVGELRIRVMATDLAGESAQQSFALEVAGTNDAPQVGSLLTAQTATQGAAFAYIVPSDAFVDTDVGDRLRYTATLSNGDPLPDWLSFDGTSGTFSGTPANGDVGGLELRITAIDLAGERAAQILTLNVANINDAPEIGSVLTAQQATEDAPFVFTVPEQAFRDVDTGDVLALSATLANGSALPSWLQFNAATRTFFGTPGNDQVGSLTVRVTATDLAGAQASQELTIDVANTNDAPEVGAPITTQTVRVGQTVSWRLPDGAFVDIDAGDQLSYTATLENGDPLPAGLSFDADSRTFSGTLSTAGRVEVLVTATDQAGAKAAQVFAFEAVAGGGNLSPVTAPDTASVSEDGKLFTSGNVLANDRDPDGDAIRVADTGIRRGEYGWLKLLSDGSYAYMLDNASGKVQSLAGGQAVVDRFAYTATDGFAESSGELAVTVSGANDAPVLVRALADVQLAKGKAFSWQVPANSFHDIDQTDTLTYTATLATGKPLPAWLKFDAATQTFSGTAPIGNTAAVDVRVVASDGQDLCAMASDVFRVSIGNKTVLPAMTKGNEGLGNGPDAPPPGHAVNQNDGAGASPGNPGSKAKAAGQDLLERFLDGFKADGNGVANKSAVSSLGALDAGWFERWLSPAPSANEQVPTSGASSQSVESHWQQLLQALNRLDAERQGAGPWLGKGQGADLSRLTGLLSSSNAMLRTQGDAVGLSASGTELKTFSGLSEGITNLRC